MSGPYEMDDLRLAQAFREVFQMKVEFDLAEEIRKATKAYGARQADDTWCPTCGKRGVSYCNCERG